MGKDQNARIEWRDGHVPVSRRFDDPYFSITDGLAETRYVFLGGNDLPDRFRPGFHIAELGFGTGLNMLTTLHSWRAAGQTGTLHFTSFEAYPMTADDIAKALSAFPEISNLARPFLDQWAAGNLQIKMKGLEAEIIIGDARETLPNWDGFANAWFLDGFAPSKNPELWDEHLMQSVAEHTAPGGSFATYTAAGFVRRALANAGFEVSRRPGYGRKRHMSVGVLKGLQ